MIIYFSPSPPGVRHRAQALPYIVGGFHAGDTETVRPEGEAATAETAATQQLASAAQSGTGGTDGRSHGQIEDQDQDEQGNEKGYAGHEVGLR